MAKTPPQPNGGAGDGGYKHELEELEARLEESRAEIRLLQQINHALVVSCGLDGILRSIVDGLRDTLGYEAATIWMLDEGGMSLVCRALAADGQIVASLQEITGTEIIGYRAPVFEESVFWPVVTSGEPLVTRDLAAIFSGLTQDDYLLDLVPQVLEITGSGSMIFAPIRTVSGIIGILGIGGPDQLGERDLGVANRFAGQAGLAVDKTNLEQQLREYPEQLEHTVRERTRELEAVNRIATTVSHSLNLDTIIRDSLEKVLDVLELKVGAVFLTDEEKAELNLMVHQGLPNDVVDDLQVTTVGEKCPGLVALKGEPIVVDDFQTGGIHESPIEGHPEFKSLAGIPLESKGKVRGVLCLLSHQQERFSPEDLKLLVTIGSEIGIAIENAWLYEKSRAHSRKMEELSITDSLTGLFNRRHFYRRLKEESARAKRQNNPLSLLVVDLDNLKDYNDALGHLKGDEALCGVAQAITASIRQDVDAGFRYGGDEFAVILPYSDAAEAGEVAERIRKTFEDFALKGTSLSIGLAELDFDEEVDDFVSRADSAMYVAKNSGGNRVNKAEK